MPQQILQLQLTTNEQQLLVVHTINDQFIIHLHDIQSKITETLYTTNAPITQCEVLQQNVVFIENNELKHIQLSNKELYTIGSAQRFSKLDDTIITYEQDSVLYTHNVQTNDTNVLVQEVERMYPSVGGCVLYRKEQQLFGYMNEQHDTLPNIDVESAALSFDGQYVALFGKEYGMRHLYVYDVTQQLLQNMTEMLGDPIGYEGPQLQFPITQAPTWTETNAFYFLVTANEEVRLYYGDLYGTLLPASPEEQRIYAYAVAKSGNWAVTALQNNEEKLRLLDITTGKEMEIIVEQ